MKKVDPFYTSKAWYRVRTKRLVMDQYRCVNCGVSVRGKGAARVDHRLPRRQYPEYALSINNLRTLCVACDNARHTRDRHGGTNTETPEIGPDGFPVGSDWS